MKRFLLIVLPLLLIVGCSQKPVEDSTLINKDGLMYTPDSDKPYTGEVFNNYSTGEKEYQGTYENGLLIQYSYLNKDGSVKEPVNGETLIERGGLMYEVNGQKPYTGDVFELYRDGGKKYTWLLKGGKKDGKWTTWDENGQKREEVTYKDGKPDGLFTQWYENGQKKKEGTFKDGELDGYIFWYENGQKEEEQTSKDGKRIKWYESGEKFLEVTLKDGKEDGLETVWYKNGQKNTEMSYKDGKDDGLCTEWYDNGQKRYEGTYKDGKEISGKWWNEDGSVKK